MEDIYKEVYFEEGRKMLKRNNEYVYQPPAKFTEELRQRINNAGFSDEFKQQIKSAQKEEGRKIQYCKNCTYSRRVLKGGKNGGYL